MCLEAELIKFCTVADLSCVVAPVPFPVGTDLVDKHAVRGCSYSFDGVRG